MHEPRGVENHKKKPFVMTVVRVVEACCFTVQRTFVQAYWAEYPASYITVCRRQIGSVFSVVVDGPERTSEIIFASIY